MPDDSQRPPLADVAPTLCALCGEPMDITHTAVAVMRADGSPGLVHPACYPTYAAEERERGMPPRARPLYDPPDERHAGA
jgi:hypothetical protein